MTGDDTTITAAILGELIPELEYAAPLLLARSDRGEPLVGATSPTDVGFETGAVDSVLLELFKALIPYVKTILTWGVLRVVQEWLTSHRESRQRADIVAALTLLAAENASMGRSFGQIAELLARREAAPVSSEDVAQSIAAAAERLGAADAGTEM